MERDALELTFEALIDTGIVGCPTWTLWAAWAVAREMIGCCEVDQTFVWSSRAATLREQAEAAYTAWAAD